MYENEYLQRRQDYSDVAGAFRSGRGAQYRGTICFPYLRELATSQEEEYACIRGGLWGAIRYARDPVVGARLIECTKAVMTVPRKEFEEWWGSDELFHACITLFAEVPDFPIFKDALHVLFQDRKHAWTMEILNGKDIESLT